MPKTYRFRRYSDECGGDVTVHLSPYRGDPPECRGKEPVTIRVTRGRKTLWAPDSPLCLSPMNPGLDTRKGRQLAAEDAVAFFEHYRCGAGRPDDE